MKIRYGTSGSSESRACVLGVLVFSIGYCCWYFQLLIGWSHDLILLSNISNFTASGLKKYCGLPYDDYSCAVLSIKPNISQYCLNDAQITGVRLLPLLLYVLELCLIHALFSLGEDCIRFFFFALGIVSAFIFAAITIIVYHDTCAQLCITGSLFLISAILFMLTMCDMFAHNERRRRAAGIG